MDAHDPQNEPPVRYEEHAGGFGQQAYPHPRDANVDVHDSHNAPLHSEV
jgi:hypothetical protein